MDNLHMRRFLPNRAASLLEYITLIAIVAGAFLIFQKYIAQAFYGRWKSVGDSFGAGRQYDPKRTIECIYDTGKLDWVVAKCNGAAGCTVGNVCN